MLCASPSSYGSNAPSLAADAVVFPDLIRDLPSYNRTLASERYVPFDQINKTNVTNLKPMRLRSDGVHR